MNALRAQPFQFSLLWTSSPGCVTDHRPQSGQVIGACGTRVAAHHLWAEYSSRPTTGAEQRWVHWIQCFIKKRSCVHFHFQFHKHIAHKPIYMIHDPCHVLLFMIGTNMRFNHTNFTIHSSGHSRGLFISASDWASAQWKFVLHILVTWSPNVNKCLVMRIFIGAGSHWPITIQSGPIRASLCHGKLARQEVERLCECPEALWIF